MRKSIIIVGGLALLTVGAYGGYKTIFQGRQGPPPTSTTTEQAAFTGQTVSGALFCSIEGMVCGTCVNSVQTALGDVEGVESVHVDLSAGTAEVAIAEGKSVEASELAKALEGTRFKLTDVKSI